MHRIVFILLLLVSFISCNLKAQPNNQNKLILKNISKDTIIVRHKNALNASYEVGFYSKSISYYWLVGADTLDFVLNVTEHEKDSTVQLYIFHKEPMLFATALEKISACIPKIKEDFDISKLSSFYFKSPLYYLDLAKELSDEYEQKFGRKTVSYGRLNQFLMGSKLNEQLNNFFQPLNKKVNRYGIEKFQLMDKKSFIIYLPNTDLSEYPEITIEGMGVYVQIVSR